MKPILLKIKKVAILQFLLLYLLLLANGSRVGTMLLASEGNARIVELCIIAVGVLTMLYKPYKYSNKYSMLFLLFLFCSVLFVRLVSGGVGITVFLEWSAYIFLVVLTVCIDVENFTTRFIKLVYYLAVISLVFFAIQILAPDVIKMLFEGYDSNYLYRIWSSATAYKLYSYEAWGKFIYNMLESEMSRNLGIYSEPGCHQIVLISALYIMLFMRETLKLDTRRYKRILSVIIITIITAQSTSGYLGLVILLVFYFFEKREEYIDKRIRRNVTLIIAALFIVLLVDYGINGSDSLMGQVVIEKLFGGSKTINLSASSGLYRLSTILTSLKIMISHPFGLGYDVVIKAIQTNLAGSAGATLFVTGAAIGIIPFFVIIGWTIYPIVQSKVITKFGKIAFVFIYFNTAFAQSEELYTGIIAITIVCYCYKKIGVYGEGDLLKLEGEQ